MASNRILKYSFVVFFIGLFIGLCVVLYRWGISVGATREKQACAEIMVSAVDNTNGRFVRAEKKYLSGSVLDNARWLCESDACVGGCKWENGSCIATDGELSGTK